MPTSPASSARSTIVVLDDDQEWAKFVERAIVENPEASGLRVVVCTTNDEATRFVERHANDILGFVQDLYRDLWRDGGLAAGVRFLNDVINRLTPWARTLVVSGNVDVSTVKHVFTAAKYNVEFLHKQDFDQQRFREALLWLLAARSGRTAAKLPTPDASAAAIIEVLELPWSEVCRYLAEHPELLHAMDPRRFEELVGEIFRTYGWEVELTARTRDGGYDIIAVKRGMPTNTRVLCEAKRFAPDRAVGVEIVRSLYGVKSLNAASQVVLATSSYVSRAAKEQFARIVPWELDFLERDRILAWCRQQGGVSLSGEL